jgi:hypothetical protein
MANDIRHISSIFARRDIILRHMNAFLYLLVALGIFASGCVEDRTAGGTTETENAVAVRQFRLDSIVSDWNQVGEAGVTVATLRLDSALFDTGATDIEGNDLDLRNSSNASVPFVKTYWNANEKVGRLKVRLESKLFTPGAQITLWRGMSLANRSNPMPVWSGIPDSLQAVLSSALVDNFENGSNQIVLPGRSAWFLDGGSTIAPSGSSRTGNALHMVSTATGVKVMAAALLANSPRRLITLDSVVVWARGQGQLRIAFEYAAAGDQKVAWSPRNLDATWKRIKVTPADLDSALAARDAVSWGTIQDSVSHLSFWFDGAGEGWIDEPRLYGVDKDDFR